MPSLKEFIDMQPITHMSDIEIIREWFCQNECEQDGLELIAQLSKSKTDKLENQMQYARTWIPIVPDVYHGNNKKVSLEIAEKLNKITKLHLLNQSLSEELINWAKEVIPTIDTPKVIFVPMVEWLKSEYGIEFKDSNRYKSS